MPAFLLILVVVVLVKWLGWWLLPIVAGLLAAYCLLAWWEKRQTASLYGRSGTLSAPMHVSGDTPRMVTVEVKFEDSPRSTAGRQSVAVPAPDFFPNVALVIKDEPLEQLLAGNKTIEMKAQHTRKRETVTLAKKGTGQIFGVADREFPTYPTHAILRANLQAWT
jgi:hypothetical protein